MYILISGGGLMGGTLAAQLAASPEGHHVVVIDRDKATCDQLFEQHGVLTVCGSGTDVRALQEAGIRKAEVAVGMMRSDADNLAFTLLARRYDVPQRLVRMREPEFEPAYELAGATTIVTEVQSLINRFIVAIDEPSLRGLIELGGDVDVTALTIPPTADVAGKTVAEVVQAPGFPPESNFVALISPEGQVEIPRGPTMVQAGCEAILVTRRHLLSDLVRFLTSGEPVTRA